MHHPALLKEAINWLKVYPGGLYIDATVGEGGHTVEILDKGGKVLGIELDFKQYQKLNIKYKKYISKIKNLKIVNDNFKNIEKIAKKNDFFPVDGILFDLGISMSQIEGLGRGFSFKKPDEPLDMRLSLDLDQTAADIVNSYNAGDLYEILARFSEEINSQAIAQAIVFSRRFKKIVTVGDLLRIIKDTLKKDDEQVYRRIFQALRIAVNDEPNNLKHGLIGSLKILKEDGRLVVISFHSVEDRLVKKFIKDHQLYQLNRRLISDRLGAHFERSAKIRVITKHLEPVNNEKKG